MPPPSPPSVSYTHLDVYKRQEQAAQRLAAKAQRLRRGDEGQARALDADLAVQPPQAIAQRQGFTTRQSEGETAASTPGLTQQARALPEQLVEIFGRLPQRDQLAVQRQRLRRALQQFANCLLYTSRCV